MVSFRCESCSFPYRKTVQLNVKQPDILASLILDHLCCFRGFGLIDFHRLTIEDQVPRENFQAVDLFQKTYPAYYTIFVYIHVRASEPKVIINKSMQ